MRHRIISLTLLLSCITAVLASAEIKRYSVKTVPNNEILDYSYVTDLSSVISPSVRDSINFYCRFAKDSLGAEIVVLTLPGIDTGSYGSLHEFGTELYNTWNIGDRKTERGLLILFVTNPDEREISFVTGYGLEGLLPDAYCKRIQANIMVPLMRDGDYGQGLLEGVKASCGIISGDVVLPQSREDDDDWVGALIVFALIFFGIMVIAVAAINYEKKRKQKMGQALTCTRCGVKGKMKYDRYVVLVRPTRRSTGTGRYYFICQNCGEENHKDVVIPRDSSGTGFAGPVGGGTFRGGGGSRSFGSFGGGFSGGGGASTRF
ncbi:MAG: TPM domain-containing protein [Candidatus Cryptobacteroides sp.]